MSCSTINCDSLNLNYLRSSEIFEKDEMKSTKNLSITYVTIIVLIVNLLAAPNPHLMINKIWVLIYKGSGLKTRQKSNLDKLILSQSEISLIWLSISSKMK